MMSQLKININVHVAKCTNLTNIVERGKKKKRKEIYSTT